MAVYRVERTRDYTVMSNYHLRDAGLSLKAKGLLAIMLSLPDDWNYSTRGLAKICKEGVDAIGKALKELEQAGYIVRRQLRGAKGRITDVEYTIYERPQKPDPPTCQNGVTASPDTQEPDMGIPDMAQLDTELPDTENPYLDRPDMAQPDTEKPAQISKEISITKKQNTDESSTQSFILQPHPLAARPVQAPTVEGQIEVHERRRQIREQIEYDCLATPLNREQIDEFVEIMLEVALSRSPTLKIGRDAEYPTALVQQRFERITSSHIMKVMEGIKENTTRVWNTKAYLLAALFNSPSTLDNHYTMLVNHDLYGGV